MAGPSGADDELLRRAKRRVGMKMGWLAHATVFVVVNALLAAINLATGGPRWHLWPLGWWGLGLAIHGAVTLFALRGEGWRERMVADELRRLRERGSGGPGR